METPATHLSQTRNSRLLTLCRPIYIRFLVMSIFTLLIIVAVTAYALRRVGWSPVTFAGCMWVIICTISWLDPLGLISPSLAVQIMVLVGLASLTIPSLIATNRGPRLKAQHWDRVKPGTLAIWIVLSAVTTIIGAIAFRQNISAASGGEGFASLSASQVRSAQVNLQGGGLAALLQATYPILGCLSILGAMKFSRWYLLGGVLALYVALQNPGRTITLSLVAEMGTFYLYCRPLNSAQSLSKRTRRGAVAVAAFGLAAMMWIFVSTGSKLGKNKLAAQLFPTTHLPDFLLTPVLYLTGGMSAMTTVITDHYAPYQDHYTSVFLFARIYAFINPTYHAPHTIGNFVPAPIPFNVFTGFGQAWWDFGWLGVVGLSIALGIAAALSHRTGRAGSLTGAWTASVCVAMMISLPLQFRIFDLDTVFQLVVGWIALKTITMESTRGRTVRNARKQIVITRDRSHAQP